MHPNSIKIPSSFHEMFSVSPEGSFPYININVSWSFLSASNSISYENCLKMKSFGQD